MLISKSKLCAYLYPRTIVNKKNVYRQKKSAYGQVKEDV